MIKLTSNLVNETIALQPAFQDMLPDKEHMGKLMDTAVNNFHSVGRTWIAKQVRIIEVVFLFGKYIFVIFRLMH
jgi:hypothetical protein